MVGGTACCCAKRLQLFCFARNVRELFRIEVITDDRLDQVPDCQYAHSNSGARQPTSNQALLSLVRDLLHPLPCASHSPTLVSQTLATVDSRYMAMRVFSPRPALRANTRTATIRPHPSSTADREVDPQQASRRTSFAQWGNENRHLHAA
jgi:hypothetical protein